jgi:hypothetical protein
MQPLKKSDAAAIRGLPYSATPAAAGAPTISAATLEQIRKEIARRQSEENERDPILEPQIIGGSY